MDIHRLTYVSLSCDSVIVTIVCSHSMEHDFRDTRFDTVGDATLPRDNHMLHIILSVTQSTLARRSIPERLTKVSLGDLLLQSCCLQTQSTRSFVHVMRDHQIIKLLRPVSRCRSHHTSIYTHNFFVT